jgi:hypothetical protein
MRNGWIWTMATAATIALGANAQAEVKKFMNVCGGKLCPFFELAATPPDGWVLEKEASKENRVQMLVPKGKDFHSAEALIYIKVLPQQGEANSLEEFIKVSQDRWRKSVPDTKITKMPEVARKNAKAAFQPYQYENPSQSQQAFEYVAFGEDTDPEGNKYFAMVVITGRNRASIEKAGAPYRAFLGAH